MPRFSFVGGEAGHGAMIQMDGQPLKRVRSVEFRVAVDEVSEVQVEFAAVPVDFDAEARFIPLLAFPEYEEQAARELYERLRARFDPAAAATA